MKRSLASLLVIFPATATEGADLSPRAFAAPASRPPVFLFEGFYAGAQIGFAGTATRVRNIFIPTGAQLATTTVRGGSVIGGLHAGYDWHSGPLVFGVVGDIDGASVESSATTIFGDGVTQKVGVQGSIRGRVGYAFDRFLVYATGGLLLADLSRQYRSGFIADDRHDIVAGPTLGLGVEYALDEQWRANIEYRANGLPTQREYASPSFPGVKLRQQGGEGEIKLGVSYRFGN